MTRLKRIKSLVVIAGIGLFSTNLATAQSLIWTKAKVVENIQVAVGTEKFYVTPVGGKWEPSGCPNAKYIVIENSPTFNIIYSQFLASKVKTMELRAKGYCRDGYSSAYFVAYQLSL